MHAPIIAHPLTIRHPNQICLESLPKLTSFRLRPQGPLPSDVVPPSNGRLLFHVRVSLVGHYLHALTLYPAGLQQRKGGRGGEESQQLIAWLASIKKLQNVTQRCLQRAK